MVVTQRLLAGEVVVFSGEHFQLDGARLEKALLGPCTIPIIIGGGRR